MAKVTTSGQNNITSPNGNSLAVFVDGVTEVMKVKDVMGNIQPLSDFTGCKSPFKYNSNATGIEPILGSITLLELMLLLVVVKIIQNQVLYQQL